MVGGNIVVVHIEAGLTANLSSHFAILAIMILKPRWGENSRNEKPRNIMQDEHQVTARSHEGQLKKAMARGSRAFVLEAEEGIMVSRCQV
jgi:hypothetical protein